MKTNNILFGLMVILIFITGLLFGNFFPYNDDTTKETENAQGRASTTKQIVTGSNSTTTAINTTTLTTTITADQEKMLNTLGIEVDEITPTMIACAETALGADRTVEVANGAELSTSEKIKLVACYK